ncbi:hypothetical protein BH23THE1_BH23THE1_06290 [soil metagenome]
MSNRINIFNLNYANRICFLHLSRKHKHYDLLMYVVLDFLPVIKIMIIEDEQDLLNLYKDFLVNKGYYISVTNTTASNVLGDYEEFKPDLVILDYKLPDGKSGIEAANEIFRKHPFASILIISAYDSVKQAFNNEKKFVAKNIKLLIKPFKLSKLNELAIDLVNKQPNKQIRK